MPSGAIDQPRSVAARSASSRRVDRADGLGGVSEGRVVGVDLHLGQDRREALVGRQQVAQLLLQQVADHPLRLRTEHIERVLGDIGVRRRLERQQPDLGAVAVGDDQLVLARERGERGRRDAHVPALVLDGHRLATLQQGVTTQGDHDAHGWAPAGGGLGRPLIARMLGACVPATMRAGRPRGTV